ncbi:MAG: polyisoprenoid-binding protein [Hydrogenophilales bacterium]|nr:polyisoprenoid-binding protein [Hydrogenophilales bacterium]
MRKTPWKYTLIASLLAGLTATSALAADSYTLDSRHTFPIFEVNHMGFSQQRGRFNKTEGKVALDAKAGTGKIDIRIDSASIDMGLDDWDKHMKGEDFFNTEKFPAMTFAADKIDFQNGTPVSAEGTLTLLGVSKPVKLNIANYRCGIHLMLRKQACGAEVSATIKRSDFGMMKYIPVVSDEVKIVIPVEAFKD